MNSYFNKMKGVKGQNNPGVADYISKKRKEFESARLESLESDNYNEIGAAAAETAEEEQDGSYVPGGGDSPVPTLKKKKVSKKMKAKIKLVYEKKNLTDLMEQEERRAQEEFMDKGTKIATYYSIAVGPSKIPKRHFCSVCGFEAPYTCKKCGMRFCSVSCNETHSETRCLKFAV